MATLPEKTGIPVVAIVGRPNVGKSTLFNALAGKRISIVEPTAGVTRDRVTTWIELDGKRTIELVDTGGIGIVDVEDIRAHVEQQILLALEAADVVVFVVDVREGVAPLDLEVAARLRRVGKPVVLVANKADVLQLEPYAGEFYALGFGDPFAMSALEGYGASDLKERIAAVLPPPGEGKAPDDVMKVAVVGKRNAGKSTFINALCREERMIVSDIPGTTRDAVDVRFERDGEVFIAIDTAGLRKKRSIENAIELFSQSRTQESIERADVVVLIMDVTEEISIVDKNLAQWIADNEKPCVLVGNKWDLAREQIVTGEFHEYLQRKLPKLQFSPVVFTIAAEGKGVGQVLSIARDLYRQAHVRVATPEINRTLEDALKVVAPRIGREGTKPKIYFATQTAVAPPTIVVFVNKPALFDERYRRYLVNRLRERFDFAEVPVRLVFRERLTIYDVEQRAERAERLKGKRRRRGREVDANAESAKKVAEEEE